MGVGGRGPGPTGSGLGLEPTFQVPKTPQPLTTSPVPWLTTTPWWNHPCWIINDGALLIYHHMCTYTTEGGNKGYSRPGFITKAWHMLLIHLDNTVTSCSVKNRPQTEKSLSAASVPGTCRGRDSSHNGWLYVDNFCTQVWLSVARSPRALLSHLHR